MFAIPAGGSIVVGGVKYTNAKTGPGEDSYLVLEVNQNGKVEYNILPLEQDSQAQWMARFGVNETVYESLLESYQRTMGIVGPGLEKCRNHLTQNGLSREQANILPAA